MARTFVLIITPLLLSLSLGCGGTGELAVASGPRPEADSAVRPATQVATHNPYDPRPGEARHVVVGDEVEQMQEEVVFLGADLEPSAVVEEVTVPAIITNALSAAPIDEKRPAGVEMIIEREGGAVQEEVVYTESDEAQVDDSEEPVERSGELIVAALSLPGLQ